MDVGIVLGFFGWAALYFWSRGWYSLVRR